MISDIADDAIDREKINPATWKESSNDYSKCDNVIAISNEAKIKLEMRNRILEGMRDIEGYLKLSEIETKLRFNTARKKYH